MTLQVLISTCSPEGISRVAAMALPAVEGVEYLVMWQRHEGGEVPEALDERPDVRVMRSERIGLSANRNDLLDVATADAVLIAVDACDAADQLMLAKWIIRNLAWQEGYDITFAPKITVGKAGSGLHIHMRMVDADGKNMMLDRDRRLSEVARRAIAGLMKLAPAITAFGNTTPTSYFRLVPHQEAPTNVCWGDRNRSVLVRVPLGWTTDKDMCAELNPGTEKLQLDTTQKQTVEIRSADGSADIYLLMASLAVALRYGYELEDGLKVAADTYVDVNIHNTENAEVLSRLAQLPTNCSESADCLEAVRDIFEARGVFDHATIDGTLATLRSYDPAEAEAAKHDPRLMQTLVNRYFHC